MPKLPPLSVSEVSARTGIPKRSILWAITQKHLKAHKLQGATGAYLIEQRDLDRWVARREKASA